MNGKRNYSSPSLHNTNRRDYSKMVEGNHQVKIKVEPHSEKKDDSSQVKIKIWCFDLSHFPSSVQFVLCSAGVFIFYLIYGYFQELIFRLDGFKPFGWYLTLIQFAVYAGFGFLEMNFKGSHHERKIPINTYGLIAFLTVATMGLSNAALGYLNFPTQVIFKCCKLIPVLIGGILIQGKVYNWIDWLACICMSIGLIFFTLADSSVSPNFSTYGVTLISLALCADALIGNVQEKVMKQYQAGNSEMVLYSYSIGFVYILLGQIVTGQLFQAFYFCLEHPMETYGYGFLFSFTGYIGVSFVLTLVKSYGALAAVTVTNLRKALTMVLSFIFFTKPFTMQYVWSGCIVLIGIYLNVYSKNMTQWNNQIKKLYHKYFSTKQSIRKIDTFENIV